MLQHTANITTYCSTLQHHATPCNSRQCKRPDSIRTLMLGNRPQKSCVERESSDIFSNSLQHIATHCNTLQHTATHTATTPCVERESSHTFSNSLQHTATHCNTLRRTAIHCNTHSTTLQHLASKLGVRHLFQTHCTTLRCTATHCNTLQHTLLQHTATLHHTATHSVTLCNTLQHSAYPLPHPAPPCTTLQHKNVNRFIGVAHKRRNFVVCRRLQ